MRNCWISGDSACVGMLISCSRRIWLRMIFRAESGSVVVTNRVPEMSAWSRKSADAVYVRLFFDRISLNSWPESTADATRSAAASFSLARGPRNVPLT